MLTLEEIQLNTLIKTLNNESNNIYKSIINIYNKRCINIIEKEHENEYKEIEYIFNLIYDLLQKLKHIEVTLRESTQFKTLSKKEITIDDLFNLDLFK